MNACKVSIYLAYAMLIYLLGSIYYFIVTRFIGTPFNDSLTNKQKEIKNKSSKKRKNIFYQGIIISLLICLFFKPFKKC